MTKEAQIVERLASIYAAKHQARAIMLVGDRISQAIGAGRWKDVRRWQCVRDTIWERHGIAI